MHPSTLRESVSDASHLRDGALFGGSGCLGPTGILLPDRRKDGESRWHVLRTRSRHEKALARVLQCAGVACYLPLRRVVRRYGARKVESLVPHLPGYVFLWANRDETFFADRTRHVAHRLDVTDQATLDWELSNLERALTLDAPLDPMGAVQTGTRVRVASGPFTGLEGIVRDRERPDRLLLQVRVLHAATALDLAGCSVEPLDA